MTSVLNAGGMYHQNANPVRIEITALRKEVNDLRKALAEVVVIVTKLSGEKPGVTKEVREIKKSLVEER